MDAPWHERRSKWDDQGDDQAFEPMNEEQLKAEAEKMMKENLDATYTLEQWVEHLRSQQERKGRGKGKKGKGKDRKGKDGKGKDGMKGKDGEPIPPPEKLGGDNWEKPRNEVGMRLLGEGVQNLPWRYPLHDDSRRCYAGYMQSPFDQPTLDAYFADIRDGTDWKQPEGRNGPIPRKTAWMVAKGCECHYTYGSIAVEPQEYPPWMIKLMQRVMPYCGITSQEEWPNSCNLNLYDDGGASVGWHSDDESLFQGKFTDIYIISLSLGVSRVFQLRPNWPEDGEKWKNVRLCSGDLMTMEGMVQKHYQHRVPREENVEGARINLTWRWTLKHRANCPSGRRRRY